MTAHRRFPASRLPSFLSRSVAWTCSAILFGAALVPAARAQDATSPASGTSSTAAAPASSADENTKYQFEGRVTSNAVYVRSGASENDYPTTKLDKDAKVTVVGKKFDWLKIVPPEGSFCYVAQAYVEKTGDGSKGKVTNPLYVRVGSSLNALKMKVATKLEPGETVEILGTQDEYFKIKPPKDVYLYVNAQFLEPVQAIASLPEATKPPTDKPADGQTGPQGTDTGSFATGKSAGNDTGNATGDISKKIGEVVADSTTQPSSQPTNVAEGSGINPPSTQPVATALDEQNKFDQLEITLADALKKNIDEQPLAELLADYQKLATSTVLPESMRRLADYRAKSLQSRVEDKDKYLALQKSQQEMRAKQQAMNAERAELEQRIAQTGVKFYAAVGTLRVSSLQAGQQTLYRLTDPNTGRTLVYLKSNDPKIADNLNKFIGVKGEVVTDSALNLKTITPTAVESVDQAKVGSSVAAGLVPPSLLPSGTQASTGNPASE